MPVIQSLNATNASFVLKYGSATDFSLWIMILAIIIILILASRFLPSKDDVGRFLIAVLSVIFAVAAVWGSLGLAHFDYTQGASTVDNSSDLNQTVTYNYIYPVQQSISSPWLTGICIVVLVFTFLNALDILLIMLQRPDANDLQRKKGRGLKI
jgi:hypothetical protein